MGSGLWRLVSVCAILALVACGGAGVTPRLGSGVGDRAPDFELESLGGRRVSLGDYLGSVVLINLWATWCPPCEAEIPILDAGYRAHRDDGFVVLGIDIKESRLEVESFVAAKGVTYPVLLDPQGRMMDGYRALGLPLSLLVDRSGVVRVRHQGELSESEMEGYLAGLLATR